MVELGSWQTMTDMDIKRARGKCIANAFVCRNYHLQSISISKGGVRAQRLPKYAPMRGVHRGPLRSPPPLWRWKFVLIFSARKITLNVQHFWKCTPEMYPRSSPVFIVVGAQSTLGGQDILAQNMSEKLTKCPNFTWYLLEKLLKYPNFCDICSKN